MAFWEKILYRKKGKQKKDYGRTMEIDKNQTLKTTEKIEFNMVQNIVIVHTEDRL